MRPPSVLVAILRDAAKTPLLRMTAYRDARLLRKTVKAFVR
jgi:hypothetical protein